MEKPDVTEKLTPSAGDAAHTMTRAGLSTIPFLGGPLTEFFSALIVPPLTRRRDEWIKELAEGLKTLEEQRVDDFTVEALSDNEAFVTTVMHATQVAICNHQRVKREALRNAVLNAALSKVAEEDFQALFLSFIDGMTPLHLRVLVFMDNPKEWAAKNDIEYQDRVDWSIPNILATAFPELQGQSDLCYMIANDLKMRGLTRPPAYGHVTTNADAVLVSLTTPIGKQFLQFITSPLDEDTGE